METNTTVNTGNVKPDLEKRSSAMAAVKGVAMGATIGAALTLGIAAIPAFQNSIGAKGFAQAFKKLAPVSVALPALTAGWTGMDEVQGGNVAKDQIKPYVERLESERNALASLAAAGAGAQKS